MNADNPPEAEYPSHPSLSICVHPGHPPSPLSAHCFGRTGRARKRGRL